MLSTVIGSLRQSNTNQTVPKVIAFTNAAGELARYYFKNNPYKLSLDHPWKKTYRFCIICGINRFSDKEWDGFDAMWGMPPTICNAKFCYDALGCIPAFVPRNYYIVETQDDQILKDRKRECYEGTPRPRSAL